ncbi:hypothetical protein [Cellulomonas sp.]|uniref:hypothetical protein n=1 Tax=Cellulomonas sp. TaxID=40001 RepID=UPI003BA8A78C
MDAREEAFEAEVRDRFEHLVDAGFLPLPITRPAAGGRRPRELSVCYQSENARVDVALVLGFMGEEFVVTRLTTTASRYEFGPATAHKGHEMRKALDAQSRLVAATLRAGS